MNDLILIGLCIPFGLFVGYGLPWVKNVVIDFIRRGENPILRQRVIVFGSGFCCFAILFWQMILLESMGVDEGGSHPFKAVFHYAFIACYLMIASLALYLIGYAIRSARASKKSHAAPNE